MVRVDLLHLWNFVVERKYTLLYSQVPVFSVCLNLTFIVFSDIFSGFLICSVYM